MTVAKNVTVVLGLNFRVRMLLKIAIWYPGSLQIAQKSRFIIKLESKIDPKSDACNGLTKLYVSKHLYLSCKCTKKNVNVNVICLPT